MKKLGVWIYIITTVLLVVWLLRLFVFSSCLVLSSSSYLYTGERIIVNKWSYGFRSPYVSLFGYHRWKEVQIERGDIIAFNNPMNWRKKNFEKKGICVFRCIAIPGDTIYIDSLFHYRSSGKKMSSEQLQKASINSLVVPKASTFVYANKFNRTLLCNTIRLYEGEKAYIRNNILFVDDLPVDAYIFKKNYYWVSSNTQKDLSDSRLFGFVPEDYIIGKASFIWFSKDNKSDIFHGYRWSRFFKFIN